MMGCRHAEYTEIPDALFCNKPGGKCSCLVNGEPLPEDGINSKEDE